MNEDVLSGLAIAFLTTAFFSIGGASALIPEFHRQIVDIHGWMTSPAFVHAVALSQIAPGPNMLIVSLIGWQVAGLGGMLVSTFAIVVPPSILAYLTWHGMERVKDTAWLKALKTGLGPIVVGLMLASGFITARAADHDLIGLGLTIGSAVLMHYVKRNPLWVIAAGALIGVAGYHSGLMPLT